MPTATAHGSWLRTAAAWAKQRPVRPAVSLHNNHACSHSMQSNAIELQLAHQSRCSWQLPAAVGNWQPGPGRPPHAPCSPLCPSLPAHPAPSLPPPSSRPWWPACPPRPASRSQERRHFERAVAAQCGWRRRSAGGSSQRPSAAATRLHIVGPVGAGQQFQNQRLRRHPAEFGLWRSFGCAGSVAASCDRSAEPRGRAAGSGRCGKTWRGFRARAECS